MKKKIIFNIGEIAQELIENANDGLCHFCDEIEKGDISTFIEFDYKLETTSEFVGGDGYVTPYEYEEKLVNLSITNLEIFAVNENGDDVKLENNLDENELCSEIEERLAA